MTVQATEARNTANQIRYAQAELRSVLADLDHRTGCNLIANRLEKGGSMALEATRIGRLLDAIKSVGPAIADLYLTQAKIAVTRRECRVRDLTERERQALAQRLRGEYERDFDE